MQTTNIAGKYVEIESFKCCQIFAADEIETKKNPDDRYTVLSITHCRHRVMNQLIEFNSI